MYVLTGWFSAAVWDASLRPAGMDGAWLGWGLVGIIVMNGYRDLSWCTDSCGILESSPLQSSSTTTTIFPLARPSSIYRCAS